MSVPIVALTVHEDAPHVEILVRGEPTLRLTDTEALAVHARLGQALLQLRQARDLTPALHFTQAEVAALLASISASLQVVEGAETRAGLPRSEGWTLLNSLRTLFAELGYGFENPVPTE